MLMIVFENQGQLIGPVSERDPREQFWPNRLVAVQKCDGYYFSKIAVKWTDAITKHWRGICCEYSVSAVLNLNHSWQTDVWLASALIIILFLLWNCIFTPAGCFSYNVYSPHLISLVSLPLSACSPNIFGWIDQDTDTSECVMDGVSCLCVRVGCSDVHGNDEHRARDRKGKLRGQREMERMEINNYKLFKLCKIIILGVNNKTTAIF